MGNKRLTEQFTLASLHEFTTTRKNYILIKDVRFSAFNKFEVYKNIKCTQRPEKTQYFVKFPVWNTKAQLLLTQSSSPIVRVEINVEETIHGT